MNQERVRKSPNIAIVGSTSLLGKELRQMIEDRGLPLGRFALLETEEYAGLLQEFAGWILLRPRRLPEQPQEVLLPAVEGARFLEPLLHPAAAHHLRYDLRIQGRTALRHAPDSFRRGRV